MWEKTSSDAKTARKVTEIENGKLNQNVADAR